MSSQALVKRAEELRDLLNEYSYQYHTLDSPSVSDAIYDGLMDELKALEAAHPDLISPDSPTQRVGSALKGGFAKVRHSSRMLSLNDVFSIEDVAAWMKRMDKLLPGNKHQYFCDIKMDGLACALVYQGGVLVQGITRGDSYVGEDITANVRTIRSVPLRLRRSAGYEQFLQGRTEIRGEIIMLRQDFESLNAQRRADGQPEFANPRNLAAGTVRQLDPELVAARPLAFRAYDILRDDAHQIATNSQAYKTILSLGITCNDQAKVFTDLETLAEYIKSVGDQRHDLPFFTDGLVVKVNDRRAYADLGIVGKQPRAAVAYKYPAEQATTLVKDIVISIGRTGAATPVAVFDPVVVAGTTVQHASLHNADEIVRQDIRIGDTVVIFKAGDIIPQVQSVVQKLRPKNARPFNFEQELKRQYPDLQFERPNGEAVYRVKGASGPVMLKRALQHYASKGALDIDTLGQKNVEALVDAGLVADLADIYKLSISDLLRLDRFAQISAQKLVDAIAAKKNPSLARFIYGLGIRHVGAQTATDLANTFKRLDSLGTATLKQLRDVEGIGDIVADSVLLWFDEDENRNLLAKFRNLGVWPQEVKKTGGLLSGQSFAITGTLASMGRDIAAEKIRSLGGTFQSAISKDTTFLVTGSVSSAKSGGSKLKKAEQYGTKIISETDLLKLLG